MWINRPRGGAQPGLRRCLYPSIGRQPGAPDIPKARFTQRQLTVRAYAFLPFAPDNFRPNGQGVFRLHELRFLDDL